MGRRLDLATTTRDGRTLAWPARLADLFTARPDLRGVHGRADVVDELTRWSA